MPAIDPARRLEGGEQIEVRPEAPRRGPGATQESLVVHLDPDVAVVRKPAGILTVPFEREDRDTLLALARVAIRRIEAAQARKSGGKGGGKASNATLRGGPAPRQGDLGPGRLRPQRQGAAPSSRSSSPSTP